MLPAGIHSDGLLKMKKFTIFSTRKTFKQAHWCFRIRQISAAGIAQWINIYLPEGSEQIAQQVRSNQGAVQEARGVYDPVIVGRASQENGPKPMRSGDTAALAVAGSQALHVDQNSTTSYGLGVEQTLGSGAHIESGFSVGSTKSEYNVLQGIPTQTTGSIRFGVRYPLQRNANGIEQSSALAASELERDASNEDLLQISATTVLNVVQTYWEIAARAFAGWRYCANLKSAPANCSPSCANWSTPTTFLQPSSIWRRRAKRKSAPPDCPKNSCCSRHGEHLPA